VCFLAYALHVSQTDIADEMWLDMVDCIDDELYGV
jgi:hypothetical protein